MLTKNINPQPKFYLHKFKKNLNNILKSNEFYKKKLKSVGIVSSDQINTWEDFFSLPLTTRAQLIKDQQRKPPFGTNLTRPLSEYTYVIRTSGTSTGVPFYQPLTSQEFDRFVEVMAYGYREMGIKKSDVICFLTSTYAYPLFYEISRRIGMRMVPVDDYKSTEFLRILKSMRVTALHGFPTAIFELIEMAQDKHIDLKKLGIKKIFTIGEVGGSHPPTKAFFENSWNTKVFDHIGALESGTYAVECAKNKGHHILENQFITEIFEPSSNRPATKGELVLTSLWRQDYPLIRYRTGDIIELDNSPCPCGKVGPRLIGGILGRVTGQIKLRSYFMFPEDIERTIRQHPEVKEYQIICTRKKGMDNVDVYLELSLNTNWDGFNLLVKELQETLRFQPKIYPVLPKTLPRFGARKGKRFHDYRLVQRDPPFNISINRRLMAKLLGYVFTWNNRRQNIQRYISFIGNILKKS